jgi:hypothetical protein
MNRVLLWSVFMLGLEQLLLSRVVAACKRMGCRSVSE